MNLINGLANNKIFMISILYLLIFFILISGWVNLLLEGGNIIPSIIIIFVLLLGILGLYIISLIGKKLLSTRASNTYFLIGISIFIISVMLGFFFFS
jgi:hypothetical protein